MQNVAMAEWRRVVEAALAEDVAQGDATTDSLIPAGLAARADLVARQPGVLAGLPAARIAFETVAEWAGETLAFEAHKEDGAHLAAGDVVATITGSARVLLRAERTALNIVQQLSGVASLTACFVDAVSGTNARIVDTRKTTPGLRTLEKYAVRCGGGSNHRYNLADGVLVKDNHLAALAAAGVTLTDALRTARANGAIHHLLRVEVEVDRVDQIAAALDAGADIILLDNMPPAILRDAIAVIGGRAMTEASGGVNLSTVRAIAETGVDLISVGGLTHSAPALDLGLDFRV